jgi:pyruvate ferredoxin oxidoreductase beta subunit
MAVLGLNEEELFASGHRACAGCGEVLALRHILKVAGRDTIVAQATGCMEVVSTPYPQTSWEVPFVHCGFQNAPAVASGVRAALNMQGKTSTNVLAMGGDGAMFDIGFGSLSGAVERGHKIMYVVTDNEAYMNTGIQRSGATFPYANTTTSPAGKAIPGKQQPKKPLPFIMAAHGIQYAASANVSNIIDLKNKVEKALAVDGPSFLHVFTPCTPGWKIDASSTITVARKAVETWVAPIYEIEKGIVKLNQKPKPAPVEEYLMMQGRFKHVTPDIAKKIQSYVDKRRKFLEENEGKQIFDMLY